MCIYFSLSLYMHIYIYTHMYACIHVYVYTCIHVYTYTCICVYTYTFISHIYIYIYIHKLFTLLDLCVSSLRRGHANLLCIVPILTDDPKRNPLYYI